MTRIALGFLAMLIVALATSLLYVRNVGDDPAVWHVDPLTAATPDTPNSYRMAPGIGGLAYTNEPVDLVSPIYDAHPAIIALAMDEFILNQPRTLRIAGTPDTGWMTYVQRSELIGYPDYISIRIYEIEGGYTTMAIFSRSRFGYGDLGVNETRVQEWTQHLHSFVIH